MDKKILKIVFLGTPEFAIKPLEALINNGYQIVGVITSSDKPVGRKQILTPSPVKILAEKYRLPVYQPENKDELLEIIEKLRPDLAVIAAFGMIFTKEILDIPKYGFLNIHPSLLPRWRGASPIQSTILAGDKEAGVTLFLMDEQIDHGPIIQNTVYSIQYTRITYSELSKQLAEIGADLIIKTIPRWLNGEIIPLPQDESLATYCHKITSEDEKINWQTSAEEIDRKVRALNPNPGVYFECSPACAGREKKGSERSEGSYTLANNKIIKIIEGFPLFDSQLSINKNPGGIFEYERKMAIKCNSGFYIIEKLKPAGKDIMTSESFLNGNQWIKSYIISN